MKKIYSLLALILVASMLFCTACDISSLLGPKETTTSTQPTTSTTEKPPHTEHSDANGDYVCDECGEELERPEPPKCEEHKDEDGDEKCDICGADVPKTEPPVCEGEHTDSDNNNYCDVCGAEIPQVEVPPELKETTMYLVGDNCLGRNCKGVR